MTPRQIKQLIRDQFEGNDLKRVIFLTGEWTHSLSNVYAEYLKLWFPRNLYQVLARTLMMFTYFALILGSWAAVQTAVEAFGLILVLEHMAGISVTVAVLAQFYQAWKGR